MGTDFISPYLKYRITGSYIKLDKVWVTHPNTRIFLYFSSGGNEEEVTYRLESRLKQLRKKKS